MRFGVSSWVSRSTERASHYGPTISSHKGGLPPKALASASWPVSLATSIRDWYEYGRPSRLHFGLCCSSRTKTCGGRRGFELFLLRLPRLSNAKREFFV